MLSTFFCNHLQRRQYKYFFILHMYGQLCYNEVENDVKDVKLWL